MTTPQHHQLIILGSGPAGCTAAIYAARANLESTMITGTEPGGQLTKATMVENWPGEDEGIPGPVLMENMIQQVKRFNNKIISDNIIQTNLTKKPFHLKSDNYEYTCDALIIATGASAKHLDIPAEQKYIGCGVSVCATCDGSFYKNKKVVVVGGGNTAIEDALYLAKLATTVTLIHRRDRFRAEPFLIKRLENTANIKLELNTTVDEILGDTHRVTGVRIKNIITNLTKELDINGVFIAIGHKPNTEIFANQLEMDQGYIKVGYGRTTATNILGVFAAGDVINQNYHQAIIAAGSGCMAALDAKKFFNLL